MTQRAPGEVLRAEPATASFSARGATSAVATAVVSSAASTARNTAVSMDGPRRNSSTSMQAAKVSLAELPLELCAYLAARIDRSPDERGRILSEMGLSEQTYIAASQAWAGSIRAEIEQGGSELRAAYERAYVSQLEVERGDLTVAEYTRLMVHVEHGDGEAILAELGLPRDALVRIERVFQERMSADPSFGVSVRQEMATTRRALSRTASRKTPGGSPDPTDVRATATPTRPRSSDR
jgi:hypothetical protein